MYGKWETVWCAQPTRNLRREVRPLWRQNGGEGGGIVRLVGFDTLWSSLTKFKGGQCMCRERGRNVHFGRIHHVEIISGATIPADHEDGEVGRCEGGRARKKVEAVGEQHCGFSPKTASRVKSRTYLHLCCKYELWGKGCMTHGETY